MAETGRNRAAVQATLASQAAMRSGRIPLACCAVSSAVKNYSRPYEDSMDATFESLPAVIGDELPIRVRDAAVFLGVSPQTVYLWVERKQIPHLRVMGRNIRFLKSDLVPFRAQFKQEMENGET